MGLFQFAVDEGVVETDFGGVLGGIGEIDARKTGPVDGAKAHGTGFARSVEFAIFQFEDAQFVASATNGNDFGVGGWIIGLSDLICAFGDDLAISHDHGAKRATAAGLKRVDRELNGPFHEGVVHRVAATPSFTIRSVMQSVGPFRVEKGPADLRPGEQVYAQKTA